MNINLINKTITTDVTLLFLTAAELEIHERKDILKKAGFKAEQDSTLFLYESGLLVCGVDAHDNDALRSASASAIKLLRASNNSSASLLLNDIKVIKGLVEGFVLGGYEFNEYKSQTQEKSFTDITIVYTGNDLDKALSSLQNTLIVAKATCFTRDIVNTAPQELNPPSFAALAKKLARENSLECDILDEKRLTQENMGAMLAVGRASVHESQLIHLTYKGANPKKVISLVGKGLTYDSGGLSLKPATSMVTMKMDKAGGCAVLGIMKAISELKLDIEVHAFIGAVENMIGGNAYKPDDILISRSKKSIEIKNTDAEGRLVLADVLSYAQDTVEAEYIFDFATLTGACMVALGQYTTGLMGHSTKLKHEFMTKASNSSGELIGHLPFNRHLKKLLKSEIADISNTASKPYGGAITAGMFLDTFITDKNKEKWLHFDIAGSAYTESAWDCNTYGGTGAGVRFMCSFLQNIK